MRCSSLELVRPSFHRILMEDMDWYGIGGVLFAATALLLSIIFLAASKRRNVEALDFFPALLSVSHSNRCAGGESTTRTLLKIVKALSQSLYSIDNCIFKRTFTRLINGRASLPLVRHFTPTIKNLWNNPDIWNKNFVEKLTTLFTVGYDVNHIRFTQLKLDQEGLFSGRYCTCCNHREIIRDHMINLPTFFLSFRWWWNRDMHPPHPQPHPHPPPPPSVMFYSSSFLNEKMRFYNPNFPIFSVMAAIWFQTL